MLNAGSRLVWVLVVSLVVVAIAVRLLDGSVPFFTYRVIDDRTLEVETVTGPGTWTRVTAVTETPTTIVIAVSALKAPIAGTGDDVLELRVVVRDPIAGRAVIDASSGTAVPRS